MISVELLKKCSLQGCEYNDSVTAKCKHCGFFSEEAERRKTLPLIEDGDGLRRKIARRKANEND